MSDTTHDEFDGQGGSYMLDPATGKRTLLERTQDHAQQAEAPAAEAIAPVINDEVPAVGGLE